MTLKQRVEVLQKRGAGISETIKRVQRNATQRAIEKATDLTPPNADTPLRGTGAITGQLKSHWATDSKTDPEVSGNEYKTVLANNVEYASYKNDGHRMVKHFVPGLIINPHSGLLENVNPTMGGIVVGTQTSYVKGLYMKEAAKETYEEVLLPELKKLSEELFKE